MTRKRTTSEHLLSPDSGDVGSDCPTLFFGIYSRKWGKECAPLSAMFSVGIAIRSPASKPLSLRYINDTRSNILLEHPSASKGRATGTAVKTAGPSSMTDSCSCRYSTGSLTQSATLLRRPVSPIAPVPGSKPSSHRNNPMRSLLPSCRKHDPVMA